MTTMVFALDSRMHAPLARLRSLRRCVPSELLRFYYYPIGKRHLAERDGTSMFVLSKVTNEFNNNTYRFDENLRVFYTN